MGLKTSLYELRMVFTNPILGSQPGSDTPAAEYLEGKTRQEVEKLRKKNPQAAAEIEAGLPEEQRPEFDEELQKGTTGFYRLSADPKRPCFRSYQIKGMLKEAGEKLNGHKNVKALRNKIESTVFISPKELPIQNINAHQKGKLAILERPLRAQTLKGPRTSLARSEMIQAGAWVSCTLKVVHLPKWHPNEEFLRDLLDYACECLGVGQWRNSNEFGVFNYTLKHKD